MLTSGATLGAVGVGADANLLPQSAKVVRPETSRMVIYDPRQMKGPVFSATSSGYTKEVEEIFKMLSPPMMSFITNLPAIEGPSPDMDVVLSMLLQSTLPTGHDVGKPAFSGPQVPGPATSDLSGPSRSGMNQNGTVHIDLQEMGNPREGRTLKLISLSTHTHTHTHTGPALGVGRGGAGLGPRPGRAPLRRRFDCSVKAARCDSLIRRERRGGCCECATLRLLYKSCCGTVAPARSPSTSYSVPGLAAATATATAHRILHTRNPAAGFGAETWSRGAQIIRRKQRRIRRSEKPMDGCGKRRRRQVSYVTDKDMFNDGSIYEDFCVDDADLTFENYEELFGTSHIQTEQLFDDAGIDSYFEMKEMPAVVSNEDKRKKIRRQCRAEHCQEIYSG